MCGRFLLLLQLTLATGLAQSTYYLASDGNDANDGLSSASPWKTISRLNAATINPGCSILFRSGDIFFGQITIRQSGSASLPIRISSYGTSPAKPVISGAVPLAGWTPYQGQIYVTQAPLVVKNLFVGPQQMTLARYPNSGFIPAASTDGAQTITAPEINRPSGYWNGATAHIRTFTYTFEMRSVATHAGSSIGLSSPTLLSIQTGWGFYLDGKLEELDAPGEWFCDQTTSQVYFYPPDGNDPNTLALGGTALDYGIDANGSNIVVENLRFEFQAKAAIRFAQNPSGIRISSNDIVSSTADGIDVEGQSTGCTVLNNSVTNANGRGIYFESTQSSIVSGNQIKNVGLVQGYGISGIHGMSGIVLGGGSNNTVRENVVDSVGYIGIRSDGSYSIVERNVITNSMLRLADGGAMYAYSELPSKTFGQIWRNNIIKNVVGNADGIPGVYWKTAAGIYLDNACHDMLIQDNTIIGAKSYGIYMQYSNYNNTIRGNVLYDCATNPGGYFLEIFQDPTKMYGNHRIVRNVFFPLDSTSILLMVQDPTFHLPGIFDSNYYCSPYQNLMARTLTYNGQWVGKDFSLQQWQQFSGQDQNSKDLFAKISPIVITDSGGTEILSNGNFTSDFSGWLPANQNTVLETGNDSNLDGGCLRVSVLGPNSNGAFVTGPFAVAAGQWYQLRFSAYAPHASLLRVALRQYHSPWTLLSQESDCAVGPERTDVTLYMLSSATDPITQIDFRCFQPDTAFSLDLVSLRPVTASYVAPDLRTPILTNETASPQTRYLGTETFYDLDGNKVSSPVQLAPFSSRILVRGASAPSKETNVSGHESGINRFELFQNFPNPCNPTSTIRYVLQDRSMAVLELFDALGRRVKTLVNEVQDAGLHETTVDSKHLATGVYFYRLRAGQFSGTKKLLLIK